MTDKIGCVQHDCDACKAAESALATLRAKYEAAEQGMPEILPLPGNNPTAEAHAMEEFKQGRSLAGIGQFWEAYEAIHAKPPNWDDLEPVLCYALSLAESASLKAAALQVEIRRQSDELLHETRQELATIRIRANTAVATVAGLREDAERYKWLRDEHGINILETCMCVYSAKGWLEAMSALDASIDAGRLAQQEESK